MYGSRSIKTLLKGLPPRGGGGEDFGVGGVYPPRRRRQWSAGGVDPPPTTAEIYDYDNDKVAHMDVDSVDLEVYLPCGGDKGLVPGGGVYHPRGGGGRGRVTPPRGGGGEDCGPGGGYTPDGGGEISGGVHPSPDLLPYMVLP